MNQIEFFERELAFFRLPQFRNFMIKALEQFPPYFMEVPSSSSGKYHSSWSNCRPLGLAKHTKAVVIVTEKLADAYMLTDEEHDAALVASFCHDAVKYSFGGGKHTSKIHEAEGAIFFRRCAKSIDPTLPLQDEIFNAIAFHQGRWAVSAEPKRFPEDFDKIGQLVHVADMVASRPGITFDEIEGSSFIG